MQKKGIKILNTVFICVGLAMALLIVIMLIYTKSKEDNKDNYHITKQEFAALSDEDLMEEAFRWAEKFCPITTNIRKFNSAPKPCRNVLAMLHLDAQVLNGGFCQFYYNGYLDYGFDYIGAYRDANLDGVADLVNDANACFASIKNTMPPGNGDVADFSRWYTDNPLVEFDPVYDDYYDEICEKITLYIRQNIKHFGD